MAEQSGFFNAQLVNGSYDRVYLAESFAKYFASFIGNGVFGGKSSELIVEQKSSPNMSINVLAGQAWINGYWYENTDDMSLSIDVADGILNRIDIVVLKWDNLQRAIRLAIKKGTSASNPSAPLLQRNADAYELKLAQIYVKAGATRITQSDITDTRLDAEVCGYVQGVVKQFDTTEFGRQLNTFIEEFKAESEAEVQKTIEALNKVIDANTAAGLVNDITTLQTDVAALKTTSTGLQTDVTELKKYAIQESNIHKGCYYRIKDGQNEWLNPPNEVGIEYRTIERYNGAVVYTKRIYASTLPNRGHVSIPTGINVSNFVHVSGYVVHKQNYVRHEFPVTLGQSVTPALTIQSIQINGDVVLYANEDMSSFDLFITIKYRK